LFIIYYDILLQNYLLAKIKLPTTFTVALVFVVEKERVYKIMWLLILVILLKQPYYNLEENPPNQSSIFVVAGSKVVIVSNWHKYLLLAHCSISHETLRLSHVQ